MSQMPQQLLVAEFMQKLGRITLPEKLRALSCNEVKLCKALIQEEDKELIDALKLNNRSEIIDAVMDSIYVRLYTLNLMGFYESAEAFELVHKSNMTKLWSMGEVKEASKDQLFLVSHFILQSLEKTTVRKSILVKRKSDGKIIKSPSYTPVDFSELLK